MNVSSSSKAAAVGLNLVICALHPCLLTQKQEMGQIIQREVRLNKCMTRTNCTRLDGTGWKHVLALWGVPRISRLHPELVGPWNYALSNYPPAVNLPKAVSVTHRLGAKVCARTKASTQHRVYTIDIVQKPGPTKNQIVINRFPLPGTPPARTPCIVLAEALTSSPFKNG